MFSNIGFGLYHSGVEINGIEYAYGGNKESSDTGVFLSEPRKAESYTYFKSFKIGNADDREEVYNVLDELTKKYKANEYSLVR